MALYKTPKADLKRKYPLYMQVGLILSLVLVVAAFTVPLEGGDDVVVMDDSQEIIELEDIQQTIEIQPPPPPPPAPPPPQEVPDDVEIEEDVIEEIDLDLDAFRRRPRSTGRTWRSEEGRGGPRSSRPRSPRPRRLPEPEPTEPEIFEVAEVQPELIGGLAALQANVEYPEFARRAGIEGQVVVQFVVDERGNVVDPVVLRSPNELLSEAALSAVRQARFTPGQQRGRPVKVRFAVPVTFRLR